MTADFGKWFRMGKTDLRWLEMSPIGRTARCDRSFNHVVKADQPRLMVDSGEGPERKRGKGKRHEYLCVRCALEFFATQPPSQMSKRQEKMF